MAVLAHAWCFVRVLLYGLVGELKLNVLLPNTGTGGEDLQILFENLPPSLRRFSLEQVSAKEQGITEQRK